MLIYWTLATLAQTSDKNRFDIVPETLKVFSNFHRENYTPYSAIVLTAIYLETKKR